MALGLYGEFRGKPAKCCPEKHNYSKGLCELCYNRNRRKEKSLEAKHEHSLRSKHKISRDIYLNLERNQNGKCAICGANSPRHSRTKFFHVDHNHKTGKIRGLLCNPCNRGIGYLQDNSDILLRASNYLKEEFKGG